MRCSPMPSRRQQKRRRRDVFILTGPESGRRPIDKSDIFLFFPLALLLQMSMVFTALFLCFGKALDRLYTSLINLTLLCALCAESRHTLLCSFYLFLRLILFLLYWTHCFVNMFLCGPMIVCNALMFWPRFYNNLFGAQLTGFSFLTMCATAMISQVQNKKIKFKIIFSILKFYFNIY